MFYIINNANNYILNKIEAAIEFNFNFKATCNVGHMQTFNKDPQNI